MSNLVIKDFTNDQLQLITKKCSRCKTVRPLTRFIKRKNRPNNQYTSHCKECMNEITKMKYWKWRQENPKKTVEDRFFEKVIYTDDCWIWSGSKIKNGYGGFNSNYKTNDSVLAHRFSYKYFRGPINEGMVIDHLCRNTSCVNPFHLDETTQAENIYRGIRFESGKYKQRRGQNE